MARLPYIKGFGGLRGIAGSGSGHQAVEDLIFNDPMHSPSHYLGASIGIGITMDAQGYLDGISSLQGEMGDFPREALVSQTAAEHLRASIQRHTPIGPYRDTSFSKAENTAGAFMGNSLSDVQDGTPWFHGSVTMDMLQATQVKYDSDSRKLQEDIAKVEALLHAINNGGRGSRGGGSAVWVRKFVKGLSSEERLMRGKGSRLAKRARVAKLAKLRGRTEVIAGQRNASGRLHDSIVAQAKAKRGGAILHATSTSYYAWFVEHGVVQALTPTWSLKGPEKGGPPVALDISQLGNYPYFAKIIADRQGKTGTDSSWLGFRPTGMNLTYSVTQRKGEQGGLSYRIGGQSVSNFTSPDSRDGAHMFEKGFNDFQTQVMPMMRAKYNKSMAAAFA